MIIAIKFCVAIEHKLVSHECQCIVEQVAEGEEGEEGAVAADIGGGSIVAGRTDIGRVIRALNIHRCRV